MRTPTQQEEDRVAIAAAVAALFGPTANIRHSRPAQNRQRDSAWTREGRLAIQTGRRTAQERGREG